MATITSSVLNDQGKVVVTYEDGNTRVITKEQAAKEKISFSSGTYGQADPFGSTVIDPTTGQAVSGTIMVPTSKGNVSLTDLVLQSRNPTNLAKIKKDLISYGIISKGTKSLTSIQNAWTQVLVGAATAKMDPYDYLDKLKAGGFGQDVVKDPSVPQSYISSPTQAKSDINKMFGDLLGREANSKEINAVTSILNDAQKKNPSKYVNGVTYGGLDKEQFLTDLITSGKYEANPKSFPVILSNIAKEANKYQSTVKQQGVLKIEDTLKSVGNSNGISLSQGQIDTYKSRIKAGEDLDLLKNDIRNIASLGQPDAIKKLMASGTDLETIYAPYKRAMAASLGVNSETITLDDPTLRMAIGPDKEMSLYDYKKAIRTDKRWQYSEEANDEVTNMINQVKRDFGFMG